ncbi:hypothetical protein [Streptomyces sp. NPDC096033]|uniref:hypothetical protein n=1 Tax=Streptomyces sp. NPDC096033 TaxID=3366071 RepID=UPI003804BE6A
MSIDHAPPGDTTVKKSITIPRSLAREIEARTGSRGFSSFMADAAAHALALVKAAEVTEDYLKDHEPFSPEEIEEARRAWQGE